MASTFTNNIKKRKPGPGDYNWAEEYHENQDIADFIETALLSTNRVISGCAITDGGLLVANYGNGVARVGGSEHTITSSTKNVTAGVTSPDEVTGQPNYIYIDNAGVVQVSITPPSGDFLPLALVDCNETSILRIADLRAFETPHTIASHSDTTATGAEMETLTNESNADPLHKHSVLTAPDGSPDPALSIDNDGKASFPAGTGINEFSTDDSLGGNSDDVVPTEKAIKAYVDTNSGGSSDPIMHVQDQKTTGTSGGAASAASDNQRTLNTVLLNQITGASLATNAVTLPAGTYHIFASAPGYYNNRARLKIAVGGVDTIFGHTSFAGTSGATILVCGVLTLASTGVLTLIHYTQSANGDGLGAAMSDGDVEVYADMIIRERS